MPGNEATPDRLQLSATDLALHLACGHATQLDRAAALGERRSKVRRDPMREILEERGRAHEAAYLDYLRRDVGLALAEARSVSGRLRCVRGDGAHDARRRRGDRAKARCARGDGTAGPTCSSASSVPAISARGPTRPSTTKLAAETRSGTILQLCLDSDLLARVQGCTPESMSRRACSSLRAERGLRRSSRSSRPLDAAGSAASPRPRPATFFDLEGDPFVADGGREYLFGWAVLDEAGRPQSRCRWALDIANERAAFEMFVDEVVARRARHPDLHVYHFAPYEPAALKRLMGRHGTREAEVDRLLRAECFVVLHAVVRQGFRVGVESYTLKALEALHGFTRELDLRDASARLRSVERAPPARRRGRSDRRMPVGRRVLQPRRLPLHARSARMARGAQRRRVNTGSTIERPAPQAGDPPAAQGDRQRRLDALFERLTSGVPRIPPREAAPSTAAARGARARRPVRRNGRVSTATASLSRSTRSARATSCARRTRSISAPSPGEPSTSRSGGRPGSSMPRPRSSMRASIPSRSGTPSSGSPLGPRITASPATATIARRAISCSAIGRASRAARTAR